MFEEHSSGGMPQKRCFSKVLQNLQKNRSSSLFLITFFKKFTKTLLKSESSSAVFQSVLQVFIYENIL